MLQRGREGSFRNKMMVAERKWKEIKAYAEGEGRKEVSETKLWLLRGRRK